MSSGYRRRGRLSGVVVFGAIIIATAMVIVISLTILGAVFSQFNNITSKLPSSPNNWLGLYNSLKSTLANLFPLLATMVIITSVGLLIIAIFKLGEPGGEF